MSEQVITPPNHKPHRRESASPRRNRTAGNIKPGTTDTSNNQHSQSAFEDRNRMYRWGQRYNGKIARNSFENYISARPEQATQDSSTSFDKILYGNDNTEEPTLSQLVVQAKETEDYETYLDESAMGEIEARVEAQLKNADIEEIIECAREAHVSSTKSLLTMAEDALIDKVYDISQSDKAVPQGWNVAAEQELLQLASDYIYAPAEEADSEKSVSFGEWLQEEKDKSSEEEVSTDIPVGENSVATELDSSESISRESSARLAQLELSSSARLQPDEEQLTPSQLAALASLAPSASNASVNAAPVVEQAITPTDFKTQPYTSLEDMRSNRLAALKTQSQREYSRSFEFVVKARVYVTEKLGKLRDKLLTTPEKAKRTGYVAIGLGVVALAAVSIASRRYNLDTTFSAFDGANGGVNFDAAIGPNGTSPVNSLEIGTADGSTGLNGAELDIDVSSSNEKVLSLENSDNLAEAKDYLSGSKGSTDFSQTGMKEFNTWANGQRVRPGDSVWSLAQRYLEQNGVSRPNVYQIDAVKDDILKNWTAKGEITTNGTLRTKPGDTLNV